MGKLTVNVAPHTYDVHIGKNTYNLFMSDYAELLQNTDRIAIIADERVASVHLPLLQDSLHKFKEKIEVKLVPGGEACKAFPTFVDCQSFLLNKGFTRNSLIIAFGGGACGDLAGFVAATFMRGIRYIQCPTTILAHDSAVGGKTAINMPEGKNMVGSFHQPSAVLFDTTLFETLPEEEIRSGMAELIKHAFISDEKWTMELMKNVTFSSPNVDWLGKELLRGTQVKADIVAADEFEHSTRKFLNFGHTFGHAVEASCGFGGLSHGESIMIGMAYSLILSEMDGNITESLTNDFIKFATRNGYTFRPVHDYSFETFMDYMQKDKKASFGKLYFVVLEKVGKPYVREVYTEECERAFQQLKMRTEELK